jgi:hypothetical protein
MAKKSVYISIYKQDYIWHTIKPDLRLKQKASCKRLCVPKYIKRKYTNFKKYFL